MVARIEAPALVGVTDEQRIEAGPGHHREAPVVEAADVEPAAVAWHGMRLAALQPGDRVAVVGGGSIGLLAVAVPAPSSLGVGAAGRLKMPLAAFARNGRGNVYAGGERGALATAVRS